MAKKNAGGKAKKKPAGKAVKKVAASQKGVKKAPAPKKAPKKAAAKTTGQKVARQAPKSGTKKGASARERGLTVEAYIEGLEPWQQKLATDLRTLLRKVAPGSAESMKLGQIVFEVGGPFAYIEAHPSSVNFGFWRGAELDDPHGLLRSDGSNVKLRHLKLTRDETLPGDPLIALIQQAVVLNLAKGDPTRKGG